MSQESDNPLHDWYYAGPTLEGFLQRGHGIGVIRAMRQRDDPRTAQVVYSCIARDHRWDWQVDERSVYLARLVRDLGLGTAPLIEQMWRTGQDPDDPENAFSHVAGVMTELGRIGYSDVVEQVHRYVRDGDQWIDVLARVVATWPTALWEDLGEVVLDRCPDGEVPDDLWEAWNPAMPWAVRYPQLAETITLARAAHIGARPARRYAGTSGDELVALLANPDVAVGTKTLALRELAKRPPQPGLLELVTQLSSLVKPPRRMPGLALAVRAQGATALESVRTWARDDRPELAWLGVETLAQVGDASDIPQLVAEVKRMREEEYWCPYNGLVDGLARFGPLAAEVLPTLRALWFETPHSYERASYLAALAAISPERAAPLLSQGLFDCEADVRLFAVRNVPLGHRTIERKLVFLRDDPLESDELRAAAAARVAI
jgi:hypothetical protein